MLNIWGKCDIFNAPIIWAKVGIKILKNCWYKAGAKLKIRVVQRMLLSVSTA